MENKKPTRASQTSKSDSTKVQSLELRNGSTKSATKSLGSTIVLRYAQRARWIQTQMGQNRNLGIC